MQALNEARTYEFVVLKSANALYLLLTHVLPDTLSSQLDALLKRLARERHSARDELVHSA